MLQNVVSPRGLAVLSYAFFLLACFIPPSVYTRYMLEPDLMFMDPATIMFYTLCVGGFVLGTFFLEWLFPTITEEKVFAPRISPLLFLLIPLFISTLIAVLADVHLLRGYPILLVALLGRHSGVKETMEFDASAHFIFIPLQLIAVTWWAFWRHTQIPLCRWEKRIAMSCLVLTAFVMLLTAIVTLNRSVLMIPVCGIVILHVIGQARMGREGVRRIVTVGIGTAIGVPLLFMAFNLLRGSFSWDAQISSLLGYTAAAYNRLAAIMSGRLHYPFGGRGVYLSSIIAHNRFLPFSKMLSMPDALDVWGSEFQAVTIAGLDGRMIWSGTFGYLFSDLGWFTPVFLFGYGIVYGLLWKLIRRGSVIAAVLYPWFGFCILFWFGTNYLFETPIEIFLGSAVLLAVYERIASSKSMVLPAGSSIEG